MSMLSPSAQQVSDEFAALDVDVSVVELTPQARTAADVAAAVGSPAGAVATTAVFRTLESERPVLVVASASNRVDAAVLAELLGEPVELAHPDWVRRTTGYPVGGVPPLPLAHDGRLFIDEDLMEFDAISVSRRHDGGVPPPHARAAAARRARPRRLRRLTVASDSVALRAALVARLRATGALRGDATAAAFAAVPREAFLRDLPLEDVYLDRAYVTHREDGDPTSSSSQPGIMAIMLDMLDARPRQRVLEIGAGTGYNAALLSAVVGFRRARHEPRA